MARAIRKAIRANRFARIIRNLKPLFFYSASRRFARITRIFRFARNRANRFARITPLRDQGLKQLRLLGPYPLVFLFLIRISLVYPFEAPDGQTLAKLVGFPTSQLGSGPQALHKGRRITERGGTELRTFQHFSALS